MSDILEKWSEFLKNNVYCLCNEFMNNLLKTDPDIYSEFENIYNTETEEYEEICQYFIISEEAYDKLNKLKEPVLKYHDIYIYGRTGFGQLLHMDFQYRLDELAAVFN